MKSDTKTQILDTAHRLTTLKGFDAFSYRDIAEEVNIKTSSIHYYFPSKADLALALIDKYTDDLRDALTALSTQENSGFARIRAFFSHACSVSGKERYFCLGGMFSADIHAVTHDAKDKLNRFFVMFEAWLEQELKAGLEDGSLHSSIKPKSASLEIMAAFEGSMLIARVRDDDNYLRDTLDIILSRIRA